MSNKVFVYPPQWAGNNCSYYSVFAMNSDDEVVDYGSIQIPVVHTDSLVSIRLKVILAAVIWSGELSLNVVLLF